jgi:hypothetical protein
MAADPRADRDFDHFDTTADRGLLEASEQPGAVLRLRLRKPLVFLPKGAYPAT